MRGTNRCAGVAMCFGVAVILTACSAPVEDAGASSTMATSKPVPSSSTTTGANAATVAQYASVVAKQSESLSKTLDEMTGDNCSWSTPGDVDVRPGYLTCALGVLTVKMQAETLAIVLRGAQKPGVPAFIGAPPPEIERLVRDTMAAADALQGASEAANPCTLPDASEGCVGTLFQFSSALSDMQSQLAAWRPYGA